MDKEYIILGDDNYWYGDCTSKKDIKEIIKDIVNGEYESVPDNVFVYEAKLLKTHNIIKEVLTR